MKNSTKKSVLIGTIAVGAVAIIVVVSLLIGNLLLKNPAGNLLGDSKKTSLLTAFDSSSGKTVLIHNAQLTEHAIDEKITQMESSLDGKTIALLTSNNALYIATEKGFSQIATDVNRFVLATSGNGIAYTKEKVLYLYNVDAKTQTPITNQIATYQCAIISPDGKSLAYEEKKQGEKETLYIYNDGNSIQVGELAVPIGISNDANEVYYHDTVRGLLLVTNAKGEVKQLANKPDITFVLNQDSTQLMFTTDDGIYVTEQGGTPKQCTNIGVEVEMYRPDLIMKNQFSNSQGYHIYVYGTETLANHFYYNYVTNYVFYLNEAWKANMIFTKEVGSYGIATDGVKGYFTVGGVLYGFDGTEGETKAQVVKESVKKVKLTSDGKFLYYIDSDGVLWCKDLSDTKAAQLVAKDVNSFYFTMSHDDYLLFKIEDTLYACKDGGVATKIAENVKRAFVEGNGTYYYANLNQMKNTCDLYGTTEGISFSLILQQAEYEE